MGLSRITVWTAGQVLTAADLNAEFNNALNNPIALISPTTGDINYASNQAILFRLENLAADPATVAAGRIWYHTAKEQPQIDDGTVIRTIPALISTDITQGDLIVSASSGAGFFRPLTIGTAGQALIVTSSGGQVNWGTPAVAGGGGYAVRGIAGGVTSSQTGSFAADYYQLRSTAGTATFQVNATSSVTVDAGIVGVGGRDQAGVFASTFVHAYVVSTGANSTTPIGLLSTVAPPTGPTLPSSCSAWGYVGTFQYSSASTGFANAMQIRGATMLYSSAPVVLTTANLVGLTTATQTVSLTPTVPLQALTYQPKIVAFPNTAAQLKLHILGSSGGEIDEFWAASAAGSIITNNYTPTFALTTGQVFSYAIDSSCAVAMTIQSYRVANGDV